MSRPHSKNFGQRISEFPTSSSFLKSKATIFWNQHAVPFIKADRDEDGFYALGLVHAHLRLGQMSLLKRVIYGRISELAGPSTVDLDYTLRILNLTKGVADDLQRMDRKERQWLQAFVAGLNDYQNNITEKPIEFKVLDMELEPWTEESVLALGRLAAVDISWFTYLRFLKFLDDDKMKAAEDLYLKHRRQSTLSFSNQPISSLEGLLSHVSRSGSNSFTVHKSKSKTGSALIANDPHLGIFAPNIWMLAGLKTPSFHLNGIMFPGVPIFALGRNPKLAWGGTNMRGISTHLFEIPKDQIHQLTQKTTDIKVRWWFDKTRTLRQSPYGPIISDSPFFSAKGKHLALYWEGHRPSNELGSFWKANQSSTVDEFRSSFANYAVSAQNLLAADANGDIGLVLAYRQPVLKDPSKTLDLIKNPIENFVVHQIKPTEHPFAKSPKTGFIASANNRPTNTNIEIAFEYSADGRIRRLNQLLSSKEKFSVDDLKEIQQDVFSPTSKNLSDLISKALESTELNHILTRYHEQLSQWDGQYESDSTGATAFEFFAAAAWALYLEQNIEDDSLRKTLASTDTWKPSLTQFFKESSTQEKSMFLNLIHKELPESIPAWGDVHVQRFQHPLGNLPVIGSRFRVRDYPARGSNETVHKAGRKLSTKKEFVTYGANSRQISDLSDIDNNYYVLLGGQDGWLGSPNVEDQLALWRKGEYFQFPLKIESIQKQFTSHVTHILPKGNSPEEVAAD